MGLPGSRPRREVESRFSRALSPGGSHVSSSPALPDGGRGRGAQADESPGAWRDRRRRTGGGARARVSPSLQPRPPKAQGRGKLRAPRETVPGSAPPTPQPVEARKKTMPPLRVGTAAGWPHPPPRWAAEQRETGPGPRPPRPQAAPARRTPTHPESLLTVGAFEGIFRPLEIGRHLGGRLSSHGVANSLVVRARRGHEKRPAQSSTRLASSRPRPIVQRREGKNHVTPARRRGRRRPSPGCRGGPPSAPPFPVRKRACVTRAQ